MEEIRYPEYYGPEPNKPVLLFECGCGHQVFEGTEELYIEIDEGKICKDCIMDYVVGVYGSCS